MSYRVNEFVVESYTNSLGQTLEPGEDVVFVTTGYCHTVSIETGKFEGVYRNPSNNRVVGTRIGTVPVTFDERVFCENGKHDEEVCRNYDHTTHRYIYEKTGRRFNFVHSIKYRKSVLKRSRVFKLETPLVKVVI